MDQAWSETSSSPRGPLPQQELTWLLNREDFDEYVAKDEVNLCCVMITSTLCRHSGVRKIRYPKQKKAKAPGTMSSEDDDMDADADDAGFGEEDEEDQEDDDFDVDADGDEATQKHSRFFREVEARLVKHEASLTQRRHVRFFHICACTEDETNIEPLIAKDPAFATYGRKPSDFEVREFHRTAYKQLVDLLQNLEVTSTPTMLFFLKGQPLRYSMMLDPAPANRVEALGDRDSIRVTGSNYVKWKRVLHNATVVRNEVMKAYDEEVREQARQARREQRKKERAERRRQQAMEDEEDEGDEEDD